VCFGFGQLLYLKIEFISKIVIQKTQNKNDEKTWVLGIIKQWE